MKIEFLVITFIFTSIIFSSQTDTSNLTQKKAVGIGYKAGANGNSGIFIDSLFNTIESGEDYFLKLKSGDSVKISRASTDNKKAIRGKRSRASIMKVVMQNIGELRNAYNKRLRKKSGLKGKIIIKFAINGRGKVIGAKVVNSSLNDAYLEDILVSIIKEWKFGRIDKLDDVTEVVYPFVFSQK